ncbi:rCG62204 [Rattus norvegicus]|uniref:RCG62204 n=1 Tax=Rattus norvegicus TaxID=10116 RepID=A6H9X8_RAT|nr:rCG62204 [Rattus norvegicus]
MLVNFWLVGRFSFTSQRVMHQLQFTFPRLVGIFVVCSKVHCWRINDGAWEKLCKLSINHNGHGFIGRSERRSHKKWRCFWSGWNDIRRMDEKSRSSHWVGGHSVVHRTCCCCG